MVKFNKMTYFQYVFHISTEQIEFLIAFRKFSLIVIKKSLLL